jgi:hypothetical protein
MSSLKNAPSSSSVSVGAGVTVGVAVGGRGVAVLVTGTIVKLGFATDVDTEAVGTGVGDNSGVTTVTLTVAGLIVGVNWFCSRAADWQPTSKNSTAMSNSVGQRENRLNKFIFFLSLLLIMCDG